MTPERILEVVESYGPALLAVAPLGEERYLPSGILPTRSAACAHALFMCREIKSLLAEGKVEKAMRWLGWVQCTLWVFGLRSIGDLKGDNRT